MSFKSKYLVVLPEPFSLDIPYTDRQRVVIVADEQVDAERRSRPSEGALMESGSEVMPVTCDLSDDRAEESPAAVFGRHLHHSLQGLQYADAGIAQAVDDRAARWALRRQLGVLMIGRD